MAETKIGTLLNAAGESKLSAVFAPNIVDKIVDIVKVHLPIEELDTNTLTGKGLADSLTTLSPALCAALLGLTLDPEQLKDQPEMELTNNLADLDPKGKSIRSMIAFLMSLLLFGAVIGYDILLWKICYSALRLPTLEEIALPILAPGVIMITYFGFLKNERKGLLEFAVNNTPMGGPMLKAARAVMATNSRTGS